MKTVIIEVETVGAALLRRELFQRSAEISLPFGAVLTLQDVIERKSRDFPSLMTLVLTVPVPIATNLVAAWLYDKFKGRARTIRIERTEITLDKGEIEKILIEKIESKE
jgi:hypothetical protein